MDLVIKYLNKNKFISYFFSNLYRQQSSRTLYRRFLVQTLQQEITCIIILKKKQVCTRINRHTLKVFTTHCHYYLLQIIKIISIYIRTVFKKITTNFLLKRRMINHALNIDYKRLSTIQDFFNKILLFNDVTNIPW